MSGDMTRMVVGLVMIAVAFIIFPIVLTGANTIITDPNIADYTGLETLAKIAPLLVFIGLLVGGGALSFTGFRTRVGRKKARR